MKKWEAYVKAVQTGEVIVCTRTRQAIDRHVRDLEKAKCDPDFLYRFDSKKVDKIVTFIESLVMYEGKGAGKNLVLEPFQAFIVASLFGWVRNDTGTRRFKKSFCFLARGNGKSPLMAAIALVSLLVDDGGQIYSIATTHSQASIVFKWAKNYVARSTRLSELVTTYNVSLEYKPKASILRPLSKSFQGFDGFNPSVIIADEVAAMKDSNLLDVMETALFKRAESLLLMITTANFISVTSPGYLEYEYSCKVLDGSIEDERYFAIVYELDKDDDWKNPDLYRKANPASFVDLEELIHARDEAANAPHKEKGFRTKNLNQWMIGSQDGWIRDDKWKTCIAMAKEHAALITPEALDGRPCCIGADFADRRDLCVSTKAYYIKEVDKVYLKHRVYIPAETLAARDRNDNALFSRWVEQGIVTLCQGDTIDRQQVADDILEDVELYAPRTLGYDPQLSYEIIERVEKKIDCVAISQQMTVLSEPSKEFEELVLAGKIIDDNPVMRWCINNARVYQSNKLIKVQKVHKDSTQRIDLVVSSIMAIYKLQELVKLSAKKKPLNAKKLAKLIYG